MPTLVILGPADGSSVAAGQPLSVTGRATDKGGAEPVMIDSVTVQVDGGAPVAASLKDVHDPHNTVVTFTGTVEVIGAEGAHTITVVAVNDDGLSRSASITVFLIGGEPPCPIAWQPNVLAPVFYGYRDYDVQFPPVATLRLAQGAVGGASALPAHPARVFYPSLDGSPEGASILSHCGRFPLIVFAHGAAPANVVGDYYLKWFEIPAALARSGYIVVVPELSQSLPVDSPGDLTVVGGMISWIRSDWEFRATALPSPATGIVGHSYGGGVAAEFVKASPGTISALASLSGQTGEGLAPIAEADIPKLFAFGSDPLMDAGLRDLDPVPIGAAWAGLPPPKHDAVFKDIGHYDYLPPGFVPPSEPRGPCQQTPGLTTELLLMFFGRYLRPEGAPDLRPLIAPSLVPPKLADVELTPDQRFYAGTFLSAFESIEAAGPGDCGVALTWDADGNVGSTNVP